MHDLQEPVVSQDHPAASRSVSETLQYATRLAQALRRMHDTGVVCGHLQPGQIVAEGDGLVIHSNQEGGGLSAYTAPELLHGNVPDVRTDVFAFGAIVYEFLTGRRAFPADDPEELKRQILEQDPAPLIGNFDGIPRLLRRCLEKAPQNRWQRMSSILIELKLAFTTTRSTHQVSEWRERVSSLQSQVAELERRLATQQAAHDTAAMEARQLIHDVGSKADLNGSEIAKVAETVSAIQETVAATQKMAYSQNLVIESMQTGLSQTDEVLEHMVDALGLIHKSMVERAETNVLAATPGNH